MGYIDYDNWRLQSGYDDDADICYFCDTPFIFEELHEYEFAGQVVHVCECCLDRENNEDNNT